MRLLMLRDNGDLSLTKDLIKDIPPYAILSHTWGDDDQEVTFKDVEEGTGRDKAGYRKIRFCGQQAASDGLQWFTRGWTLQELLAPSSVEFFSAEGQRLGDKNSLEQLLREITRIEVGALRGRALSEFTVDERMSWSDERETKREEDRVYSLLGIFNVHLLPIYGEGVDNAFARLQEEVSKHSTGDGRIIDEKAEMRKELLDLLYFDDIDSRLLTLRAAHNKTCRWFLEKEQYKDWMTAEKFRDHHGFIWIKGKPGAGKSTLMKFLDSEAKKVAKSESNALVASFFFNARGDLLEKSTTGLYRSLLWQLFEKAEDLQGVLDEFDSSARRIIQRDGWQLEILKETLAKAVEGLGCRTLQFFIDALDECHDDDVADMVSFFEDIGERAVEANVRLHICFSSRHYPTVIIRWGTQIVLEDEDEHGTDITRYIKSKLKVANARRADSLRSQIREKSAGVFLWVALVIPMLNKASAQGRVDELQKCLNGIPPGLDELFEMILMRDREEMQEFRLCVQWILFAKRPLKLVEYFFAIRSPNSQEASRCRAAGDLSTEVMCRFVHSSSKGLAEATKTRNKDKMPTIQFIHESVRDFFLVKHGDQRLWPDIDGRFIVYSHEVLRDRCMAEIYGSTGSSTLANPLQSANQSPPMVSSQVKFNIIEHEPPNNLLPKASSPEASSLRRSVSDELPFLECKPRRSQTPLLYAAEIGYEDIVKLLLETGKVDADLKEENNQTPLSYAAKNGHKGIVKLLLETGKVDADSKCIVKLLLEMGKVDVDSKDSYDRTPLLYAAAEGHERIVKVLLATGKVDADSKGMHNRTPLSYAAENGHKGIIKLLLETGKVDTDSKDSYTRTPLLYAAVNGHKGIVKLLVETGKVGADSKDPYGRTALSYAAEKGHEGIVKLLLETGKVDADSEDSSSRTPLSYAAENGHKGIAKLLLETGKVDAGSKDKWGQTPRTYASNNGYGDIVKLLYNIL
ncbi:hypothetical protein DL768_006555 [Monosporascus sp. mg162]|nr:hypothetical protein DL768_006555 [Monosporascus sp. mg162]